MLCVSVLCLKDLKDLKTEEIFSRQLKQMEKEKQEMVNNLKKQEKKVGWRKEGYRTVCVCVCVCVHACVQREVCMCGICCI